jgi:hypothetical protein
MMSEMQADLKAALAGCRETETWIRQALDDLTRHPLPAPALTEQAIVDALKADPAMAGRVIARLACELMSPDRAEISRAAREHVIPSGVPTTRGASLQSLAVALAAASYRG